MDRTKFFQTTIVDGVKEVDFLWNTISSFRETHTPSYYRVDSHDVSQPDLISKKMYDTERFWWIICSLNQIENPLEDIVEGTILKIPSIYDIYDFYQKFAVR